jgi:hypothetical protein
MFYINKTKGEMEEDDLYYPENDTSVMTYDDTRKTKLTLKQINELRRASDKHLAEQEAELEFISRMYSTPAPEA